VSLSTGWLKKYMVSLSTGWLKECPSEPLETEDQLVSTTKFPYNNGLNLQTGLKLSLISRGPV
jgi:hypothetical protein